MKYTNALGTAFITATIIATASVTARGETILQGLDSTTASSTVVAGSIDTASDQMGSGSAGPAYVTAVFGGAVYIQDTSGAVYIPSGNVATSQLYQIPVGSQVTGISGGGFEYYSKYNEFEYYAGSSTASKLTVASVTSGSPSAIPSTFYTTTTAAGVNANQGSSDGGSPANVVPGYQNQLVTLDNVTITPLTAGASSTTFTKSDSYTITDSTGTVTLYVNANSGIVGTAIPQGLADVTGIDQEYTVNTPELLPRFTSDIVDLSASVPEPTTVLGGALMVAAAGWSQRRRLCAALLG